jgi:prophage antirepressor-like protein
MNIVDNIHQENNIIVSNEHILQKQFQQFNIQIYGTLENPFFKAKDIGDLLGIKKIRTTLDNLDDNCKVLRDAHTMGGLQEQWFLTEDGLYELIFISRKPIAKQFKIWVRSIIKEIRINSIKQLEEKLNYQEKQLSYYKELTFEQVNLNETSYVFSTDIDGVYKIGKTDKPTAKKRAQQLQTACVEEIQIFYEYHTCNSLLLEKTVHYILERYRCNSNREHFRCKLDYIKMIINLVGKIINTCKSSYQTITYDKLKEKIEMDIPIIVNTNENKNNNNNKNSKKNDNTLYLNEQLEYISQKIDKLQVKNKTNKYKHDFDFDIDIDRSDLFPEIQENNKKILIQELD